MKLTLGFSPCPNDTFIFDAMIHHKIDTEGIDFEVVMEDVEALNKKAFAQQLDITKLSYHAYAYLTEGYVLLDAGSALGNNCGPLLIGKKDKPFDENDINQANVVIPGKYTTANFLLNFAFPNLKNKEILVFNEIEQAVLSEKADAGVIIHENRFTFEQKGLKKWLDLGEYWETTTGYPIPLGGIVAKRTLGLAMAQKISRVIHRSLAFAFENRVQAMPFVRAHAQEMSEAVMLQHIDLYVNQYSLSLGEKGRAAVEHLFHHAIKNGLISDFQKPLFCG
jgi:1,4-dihydroxy-6-naphthoate synthase